MSFVDKDTLKIIIIAYWHDPRFKRKEGGLIRIYELANSLVKNGHTVTVILPRLGFPKRQTKAKVVEIPFFDIPLLRPLCFHIISTFSLLFHIGRADCFYVRQLNSFFPLLIAKVFRIPSVFEIPNDPYLDYMNLHPVKRIVIKFMDRLSIFLADKIVVLSGWSKGRLVKIGGVNPGKIEVFPSGADVDLFRPMARDECCKKINLDPELTYIGFVGSFFHHQGLNTILDAAPTIITHYPKARFLLVGDGPARKEIESRLKDSGLAKYFILTGQVPYREVPQYVGAMSVCLAPHIRATNQASPVKIFDYLACGRPIVASDIEVVREIDSGLEIIVFCQPGDPGELAEKVLALLNDEETAEALGQKGRALAEKFDRKLNADRLVKVIAHLKEGREKCRI